MQEVWQFLVDNWKLIAGGLLALLSLIISIFRKRPKVDSVLGYIEKVICDEIPSLICYAEKHIQNGEDKKLWVMRQALHILETFIVLDENAKMKARNCFDNAIELYLNTPQKKD